MKKQITVSGLYYYPIKSCAGVSLNSAEIKQTGIKYDRQWMIVDENGKFISQRTHKSMALIKPLITLGILTYYTPIQAIGMPVSNEAGKLCRVKVWDDEFEAIDAGDDAADYFTTYLSKDVPGKYRLVKMLEDSKRSAKMGAAKISFADAYSFLVISEESLQDLNNHMLESLPMNRFRPNIVITGCPPYFEDTVNGLRIGEVEFPGMTLCVRCPITTTNQLTTERKSEPLLTLSKYRKHTDKDGKKGVVFGRNFNHIGTGWISLGDTVEFI